MAIPAPQGPFGVGCITLELTDPSRTAHLLAQEQGRRLALKLWYPAASSSARTELVWQSLRDSSRTPAPVRALLSLLRRRTASRKGMAFAPEASGSVVIYNHGLVSFAEENVSLMEALASEGHIVIAIEHHAQMAELQGLNARQTPDHRRASSALAAELARAAPLDRSALARQYYAASPDTGRIVRERATDTRWVLDQVDVLLGQIPGLPQRATPASDTRPLGVSLAGFSLGGAVSVEVALQDSRVCSVMNIDGGTQGSIDAAALPVPCLMLYSEGNAGMNDALLPAATLRWVVPGTRHLNFHDVSGMLPGLRFTRALGTADPLEALRERNLRVCSFLAAHASGKHQRNGEQPQHPGARQLQGPREGGFERGIQTRRAGNQPG